MAQVLTTEQTLEGQRTRLARENSLLVRLNRYLEWPLAVLLVAGGGLRYVLYHHADLLIAGGVLLFFSLAHWMKLTDNARDARMIGGGRKGEIEVSRILAELLGDDTYILNDITLPCGRGTAQIDHLVVGPNGLFVIETKNWHGVIRGSGADRSWKQFAKSGGKPRHVSNPIRQNRRHVLAVKDTLSAAGLDWPDTLALLINFSSSTVFDIKESATSILSPREAAGFIHNHQPSRLYTAEEIQHTVDLLRKAAV
jgi:hypothetical protein